MGQSLADLARALTGTSVSRFALYLMTDVPGFAPIVQTVHLLCISVVMGSIVMIDLKVLGLALPSQNTPELIRRLMPWTWGALPCLAMSGLVSFFARPSRYLVNPVFGMKFAMLAPAILLGVVFQRASAAEVNFWGRSRGRRAWSKTVAVCSLLLWIGVAMAGRWIAYVDYLFPE